MRVVGLPSPFYQISRHLPSFLGRTTKALERGRWLSAWQVLRELGLSSTQASQSLLLPRSTLYRWQKRLRDHGPKGLEDRSRRPHHRRLPTWSPQVAEGVLALRERYPRWGKSLP